MKPSDQSGDTPNASRPSQATRRIVVEDLPPEESQPVRGRKLVTPSDLDSPAQYVAPATETFSARDQPTSSVRASPMQTRGDIRQTMPNGTAVLSSPPKHKNSSGLNLKRLLILVGVIVALPIILVGIILVLPTGKKRASVSQPAASAPSPAAERPPEATATVQASPIKGPTNETSPNPTTVGSDDVRAMSVQLASQISQKSGYEFAAEFVELIRARTQEYNNQKALGGARQYRREINKSFRDEGLNPLVGYALAMSRSKFDPSISDKGIGIWQMPAAVARSQGYLSASENNTKLKNPETSAQIGASYTKQLLSTFEAEDFMYAIGCFGLSLQEAGRLQGRLVQAAPDSKSRRDVMKMIRAGVLSADQVDNIARFFAAGIVGENPQKFGLDESQSFSSLY